MNDNNKSLGKNGYQLPKKVGLIYSFVKRSYFPTYSQYITENDSLKEARLTAKYLNKMGIETILYPGNGELSKKLSKDNPDVVINITGSVHGQEFLAASIPGVLEILEIPYTGAGILGESLSYNKFLVNKLLEQNGIPVPNYQLFYSYNDPINPNLRFPLMAKLNEIHGAVELTFDSISETEKHLRERLKFLIKTYDQPVLVQEFIVGREITAVLLEGLNKKVYLAEVIMKRQIGKYTFKSFELQWYRKYSDIINYQTYKDPILNEYVKKAFSITDMADYGRFDIRLDNSGRYYFLDANSNPHLAPFETGSPVTCILKLYGLSFTDIMKRLLINTVRDAAGKEKLPITP